MTVGLQFLCTQYQSHVRVWFDAPLDSAANLQRPDHHGHATWTSGGDDHAERVYLFKRFFSRELRYICS